MSKQAGSGADSSISGSKDLLQISLPIALIPGFLMVKHTNKMCLFYG